MSCFCARGASPEEGNVEVVHPSVVSVNESSSPSEATAFLRCGRTVGLADVHNEIENDESFLPWMNFVLTILWPKLRLAGNQMGAKIALAAIQQTFADCKEGGRVEINATVDVDMDLGLDPPKLSNIRAYHQHIDGEEAVEVDVAMCFRPQHQFKFEATVKGTAGLLPINVVVGVNYFEISGVASLVLAPLFDDLPVIGGLQFFFLDTPAVHMQFSGMASLGGPLANTLKSSLRACVVQVLQDKLVCPRCLFKPLRNLPLRTRTKMASPLPEGCLLVTVHAAKDLRAADWRLFREHTSDPAVEVSVGRGSFRTRAILRTTNPRWDPPETGYLLVHNVNQTVKLEVYDEDVINQHDFLAFLDGYSVASLVGITQGESWLDMTCAPAPQEPKKSQAPATPPKIALCTEFLEVISLLDTKSVGMVRGDQIHADGGPRRLAVDHINLLRVCTVNLLGLDCDECNSQAVFRSTCHVTFDPAEPPEGWYEKHVGDDPREQGWLAHKLHALAGGLHLVPRTRASPTRHAEKSRKASYWGSELGPTGSKGAGLLNVSKQMQQMMEKLHREKQMPVREIAEVADMDEETVRLLIGLRRSFVVVWHQAFHSVLEYPGGTVTVEVRLLDGRSLGSDVFDLSELEGAEHKSVRRAKLDGSVLVGDVFLEYEVEHRGLQKKPLTLPRGQRSLGLDKFGSAAAAERGSS